MTQKIDLHGNMLLTAANKIIKICKPLESININFFRYMKLFNDGSRIILTNQPDVMRYYYEEGNYELTWYDNSKTARSYYSRCNIWAIQSLSNNKIQRDLEENLKKFFNLTQGIAYLYKQSDSLEIFDFSDSGLHIYDVNQTIFKHFMFYFKEQAKKIIKSAHYEKIKISTAENNISINVNDQRDFLRSMPVKKYYLRGGLEDIYLTYREIDCLNWCVKGKTAEETAMMLGTKRKTIERHLENIKQKLNCHKQSQLIRTAIEQDLIHD